MSTQEEFAQGVAKARDAVKNESAKTLIDIDAYTSMATSHPYAANDDIQQAIEVSRRAQDAVSEIKSNTLLALDAVIKEQQNNTTL